MKPITFAPKYLYRYRSLPIRGPIRAQELAAITTPYLWCGDFRRLNDPMEGSYTLGKSDKHEHYDTIQEVLYARKTSLGVCSFSETNNNGPMWAHYADQFRGVCIEYDLRKLLRSVKSQDDRDRALVRMTYSEDLCQLSLNAPSDRTAPHQVLSYKSHRWLYEREWRLFKSRPGKLPIARGCISHVFVGERMDHVEREKLKRALGPTGIPISGMQLDGYAIAFDLIDSR